MDWVASIAKDYGLLLALLLVFLYKELWPFLRDKLWPAHIQASADDRNERRRYEDQAVATLKETTVVLVGLQKTLENMGGVLGAGHIQISLQLATQLPILLMLSENVAGLYGHLGAPRPSQAPVQPPAQPKEAS